MNSSNTHQYDTKLNIPFVRWRYPIDYKPSEFRYAGQEFIPEALLVLAFILSLLKWIHNLNSVGDILVFIVWTVILFFLCTLAIVNFKTLLLPDKVTKPLGITVVIYQAIFALNSHNWGVILSAVLGALILGGIPYVLFQVSAGRWIGGGDVKLGFIAGLLLGWKQAILCSFLLIILFGISFIVARRNIHHHSVLPTGYIWSLAIVLCAIYGAEILKLKG